MCELEPFIPLQYARELYGKVHLLYFLYKETYGILIFSKNMSLSHVWFTAILKYLSFDDKPNRRCTGPGAGRFTAIRVSFQTLASMSRWKYRLNISLTLHEQLMLLRSRWPFITYPITTTLTKSCFKSRLAKYGVDGNSFFSWYKTCAWRKFHLKISGPIPLPST